MTDLIFALAGAIAVAFVVLAVMSRLQVRNMSKIAIAQAIIEEQGRIAGKLPFKRRFQNRLARAGYTGDLPTFIVFALVLYCGVAAGITLLGLKGLFGLLAALPLTGILSSVVLGTIAARRKRKFDGQLVQALEMIANQIAAGMGPQRAIEQVTPSVGEPLRSEFRWALNSAVATKDLPGAMRQVAARYPSRAFDLFIAALEIDRDMGGRIEPALRKAAEILKKDFELQQEAAAEVAQSKYEFYAIVGIVCLITFIIVRSDDSILGSPLGVAVFISCVINMSIGIFRVQRIIRGAGRE